MKISYAKQSQELEVLKIKLIESVTAINVLILSAHSGDDVFACGGLIGHLAESAKHIKAVYFSDKLKFASGKSTGSEMLRTQEEEAVSGLRVLGVHEVNFFRMKEISAHQNIALKILEELKTREWDLVICPAKEDWNLEHRVINGSLQTALKYKLHYKPILMKYGLLGVHKPDVLLNIDKYASGKQEAIKCHKSLLRERNLIDASFGMSSYLANITGISKHAEGYYIG